MEKGKTKNNSILRIFAVLFLLIFCGCFLVGCVNMGVGSSGGSGGSSAGSSGGTTGGSTGGSTGDSSNTGWDPREEYKDATTNSIKNLNDVFMGAVGIYEVDSTQKIFYDDYTEKYVSFNYLIDRQFETLASLIYDGLNYAYGDNTFSGNLSGYGASNISYTSDDLISEKIYNYESTLKYPNSMNGGYDLEMTKVEKVDSDGNPAYDDDGNQVYDISFNYTSTLISDRKWNKILTSPSDLVAPLKYIYLNTKTPENISSIDFNDATLKNYYVGFNGSLDSNENIFSIGFTEEYFYNVLYYLGYSVIGETNLQNSIDATPYVFNGSQMKPISEETYEFYEKYKGYDKILISLIDNVSRMTKSGNNVFVSDNYCYSGDDWGSTLFPMLMRYEYIFYDDLDDISDAEDDGSSGLTDGSFDIDKFKPDADYSPTVDPDFDPDDELDFSTTTKAGTLKKLKEIILLPTINKVNYNKDEFSLDSLAINFATANDTIVLVNILTDARGKDSDKVEGVSVEFSNNSYGDVVLPDGTVITSDSKQEESAISKDGYLIVDKTVNENTKEVELSGISADLFGDKKITFSDLTFPNNIINLFNSDSYKVESTSEEISIGRMKVCNNLFLVDLDNQIYTLNLYKNYIKFTFEYYDINGNKLSIIPDLYLMDFSINE